MSDPISLDTRRCGAAILGGALRGDTDGVQAITDLLDDQELHDALMAAVACAAHVMRDTEAEQRLADVIAGASTRDE